MPHNLKQLFDQLFAISPDIRYAAIYRANQLEIVQRPELQNASSSESDKYEELIVNPTLLTLVKQRGQIDCGGIEYVLIRYGNFFQLVLPIAGGHLSVAIEPGAQPLDLLDEIRQVLLENGRQNDASWSCAVKGVYSRCLMKNLSLNLHENIFHEV